MSYLQENARRALPLWWIAPVVIILAISLGLMIRIDPVSANKPSISLEQCRNGSAANPNDCLSLGGGTGWQNGNAGASNAHFVEGHSIPYRAIMTNMPTGEENVITLDLAYDIKHSGRHAIDFLTHFQRLTPHGQFGDHHTQPAGELVDPRSGVSAVSESPLNGDGSFPIPAPSSAEPCASPVTGQPTVRFNSLSAAERVMTIYGGTITDVQYVSPQGCLTDAKAETVIRVTFTLDSSTAVLAWGGHIARSADWDGMAAPQISGSPYHMRVKGWNLGNLGNQDRSLSAAAVLTELSTTQTSLREVADANSTTPIQAQGDAAPVNRLTVTTGAWVRDLATVVPSHATGNVTFIYYSGASEQLAVNNCVAGTNATTVSTNPVSDGTALSDARQFTSTGFFAWRAFFVGDDGFEDSQSDCSDEILEVRQNTTTTTRLEELDGDNEVIQTQLTDQPDTSMTANNGARVRDVATVSPADAAGSVVFRYYSGATEAAAISACNADTDGSSGTLVAGGNTPGTAPNTVTSAVETFNASGYYAWRAFFTGTGLSNDSMSACNAEILEVRLNTSTTTELRTVADATSTTPIATQTGTTLSVTVGAYVRDLATVTPSTATGDVAFKFYSSEEDCDSDTSGTTVAGGSLSSGQVLSAARQFNDVGTFYWRAFFTGTGLSNDSASACNAEILIVGPAATSMNTSPWIYPNDSATISATVGGNVAGSVTFRLYNTLENCTAGGTTVGQDGLLYAQTVNLPGDAMSSTVSTSNNDVPVLTSTTVYWRVSFASSNNNHQGRNSNCTENIAVTLTGDTDGTAP